MRSTGVIVAVLAAVAASVGDAAVASADTVVAPQVFVRQMDPDNETVALSDWQPVAPSATLTTLGPWEVGVAFQAPPSSREAAQVDLVSQPPGPIPSEWAQLDPYAPFCSTPYPTTPTIGSTGALLNFHGDGAYTLNVSMYTDAQHQMFPGNTCTGGPTTQVTLNVNALPTATIAGTPLAPRTYAKPKGNNGLVFSLPQANEGSRWRCALNPTVGADGSVSGTVVTTDHDGTGAGAGPNPIDEALTFTQPGRWACSVIAYGGDTIGNVFPTPWVTTPTVTVHGQYERRQSRLIAPKHGREGLVVTSVKGIEAAAAGGKLTFSLLRATCVHRTKIHLQQVVSAVARVNGQGVARFHFRSATATGYYLGRFTFGGTALVLPGRDVDATMTVGLYNTTNRYVTFLNPAAWDPCAGR